MFVNLISIVSLFSLQGIEFVDYCYLFIYLFFIWISLIHFARDWLNNGKAATSSYQKIDGNFHANISLVSLNQIFPINYLIYSVLKRR